MLLPHPDLTGWADSGGPVVDRFGAPGARLFVAACDEILVSAGYALVPEPRLPHSCAAIKSTFADRAGVFTHLTHGSPEIRTGDDCGYGAAIWQSDAESVAIQTVSPARSGVHLCPSPEKRTQNHRIP